MILKKYIYSLPVQLHRFTFHIDKLLDSLIVSANIKEVETFVTSMLYIPQHFQYFSAAKAAATHRNYKKPIIN